MIKHFALVQAGFPSPADDFIEQALSLDELLIDQPAATFFVRVVGLSMINAGIVENDILVVNKSLSPRHGDIVIAIIDGDFTLKTLSIDKLNQKLWLCPANPKFPKIPLVENSDNYIWGVVSAVVRKIR